MVIEIVVSLRFEATHSWSGAPKEVGFLASEHRHEFHIRARKEVAHADRDIEIVLFKRSIQQFLERTYPDHKLGSKSCEMLAVELMGQFNLSYCEVLEDGENGAAITA